MDPVFRLTVYAEKTRDYLLGIYSQNGLAGPEYEILSALTLGYKKSMDAEIKQVFSATGAAHVLAVSGLHVGIVYMVFNLFFGFLRRQKATRYPFLFLAVLFLWGFAFITGLSPSVQRSALMFTVVLIGENLHRPANIYNTLASSASLLLVVNPNLVLDVGFQLSYAAVLGIVYFQPIVAGIFRFTSKAGSYLWGLFAVSVAAQMTTFPLFMLLFSPVSGLFLDVEFYCDPGGFSLYIPGNSNIHHFPRKLDFRVSGKNGFPVGTMGLSFPAGNRRTARFIAVGHQFFLLFYGDLLHPPALHSPFH